MARVALFDPCYMATLRPGDINHARHVLETLGDTVTLIDGRCCGQPAFNSGFRDEARSVGRQLLKAGQPFEDQAVSANYGREAADQSQVQKLKQKAYEAAVKDLLRIYGG